MRQLIECYKLKPERIRTIQWVSQERICHKVSFKRTIQADSSKITGGLGYTVEKKTYFWLKSLDIPCTWETETQDGLFSKNIWKSRNIFQWEAFLLGWPGREANT